MRRILYLAATALLAACVAEVAHRGQTPRITVTTPPPMAGNTIYGHDDVHDPALFHRLSAAAPSVDPAVLNLALRARTCAIRRGAATADSRLAVIDYTRPSTQRRLWVFDMQQVRLLFDEYVAHGRGSGEDLARTFSNVDGSLQSSLGLFTTAETYEGDNGYSLRMDGLEPGVNDHARSRALVIHGAWYVDPLLALKQGRLGRSYGCPAVRPQVAHAVIDSLKQGQLLFAYYPDRAWLANSHFLDCGGQGTAAAEPVAALHASSR